MLAKGIRGAEAGTRRGLTSNRWKNSSRLKNPREGILRMGPLGLSCPVLLLSLLVLGAIGSGGCSRGEETFEGPYNVILLSIDTLRYDHLSYAGYERKTSPNLDRLAAESVRFSNAFAPRGQTWPSLTSAMTGLNPISHGVRHNGELLHDSVPTLAEVFKSQGYDTAAFLTNFGHSPNRGFDAKASPSRGGEPHHSWDLEMTEAGLSWLSGRDSERPFLFWLHLLAPHADYDPPVPYDKLFDTGYQGSITGSRSLHMDPIVLGDLKVDQADRDHIISLYDGEVAYADSLVGRVLDALRASGELEKSIVVFFSDHGDELFDHANYIYHGCSIYDSVLRVPLLFRFPGGRFAGRESDALVALIDLLPTVLEFTGAPTPIRIEGESLIGLIEGGDAPQRSGVFSEWARSSGNPALGEDPGVASEGRRPKRIFAIRTDRHKYIYNPGNFAPANFPFHKKPGTGMRYEKEELYEIVSDPGETKNLAKQRKTVVQDLQERIKAWLDPEGRSRVRSSSADPEIREALKNLGYIGDDGDDGEGE